MITYGKRTELNTIDVIRLFESSGIVRPFSQPSRIKEMILNSDVPEKNRMLAAFLLFINLMPFSMPICQEKVLWNGLLVLSGKLEMKESIDAMSLDKKKRKATICINSLNTRPLMM